MKTVRVEHSGASYDVLIGDLASARNRITAIAGGVRLPVISDPCVFSLYGGRLGDLTRSPAVLVPEGERAKDWAVLTNVIDELAELGVTRGMPILALGGGSVGDVAGLAASLFKRGCPIIHVPTTLLAQADSAIGGKTAIDAHGQKNLVGTFHHPALVVADPSLLASLDQRQLRSGYAEVVKYGLIDDPAFFAWCEANGTALIDGDMELRRHAVEHGIRAKTRFISADPLDSAGQRALLNFGHSFGHAIEAAAGHDALHGEAVAVGMTLALRLSNLLEMCPPGDVERVRAHFVSIGLPTELAQVGLRGRADELFALMTLDKKADRSGLVLVLASGIGQAALVRGVEPERLDRFLREAA